MKQVCVAEDLVEAQSIKDLLEAVGIESVVQGEYLSSAWGAAPTIPSAYPSIWVVRDVDLEQAIHCVEDFRQNPPAPAMTPWKCERCGEVIDGQFEECWKCSADQDTDAVAAGGDLNLASDDDPERDESDSDATADEPESSPPVALKQSSPDRSCRELWIETAVVILVYVATSFYAAIAALIWPQDHTSRSLLQGSISFLVIDSAAIGLVLYVIWRSGEPWSAFGLVRPRWIVDFFLGVAIWAIALTIRIFCWRVLVGLFGRDIFTIAPADTGWSPPNPNGLVEILALVISVCVSASTEELVMRAYLVPRFKRLLGSSAYSVTVTAALFAILHIYQGVHGTVSAFIMGLMFGTMFLWCRRLWPVAVAHAIGNLVVWWSIFADRG